MIKIAFDSLRTAKKIELVSSIKNMGMLVLTEKPEISLSTRHFKLKASKGLTGGKLIGKNGTIFNASVCPKGSG